MTDTVREQILAIRDTGLTNMFDVPTVQRLAYDRGYYELVCYLEEHRRRPSAPLTRKNSEIKGAIVHAGTKCCGNR